MNRSLGSSRTSGLSRRSRRFGLVIAATSAGVVGAAAPITVGAIVASAGFSLAAGLTMWALRSCNFDSPGWFPNDFANDVENGRSARDLSIDFALDFQIRLSRNRRALLRRGSIFNLATTVMLATPLVALVASLMVA